MGTDKPSHAIVSCCDRNYLWGAFLLVASLRQHDVRLPIYLLTRGLSTREQDLLTQFDDVHITQPDDTAGKMKSTQKPEAVLLAIEHDVITWMDADCMVTGNVTPLLALKNKGLMVRFRHPEENKSRFGRFNTSLGEIPEEVLDTWRNDVGEERACRIETTCSLNTFTIGKDHLYFVLHWQKQLKAIEKKDPATIRRIYPFSTGIGISDELVFNSLLAFAHKTPPLSRFTLDKNPDCLLIHFVLTPKPWVRWSLKTLRHRALIEGVLDWVEKAEYAHPEKPAHFVKTWRPCETYARAGVADFIDAAKKARRRLSF